MSKPSVTPGEQASSTPGWCLLLQTGRHVFARWTKRTRRQVDVGDGAGHLQGGASLGGELARLSGAAWPLSHGVETVPIHTHTHACTRMHTRIVRARTPGEVPHACYVRSARACCRYTLSCAKSSSSQSVATWLVPALMICRVDGESRG